MTVPQVKPKSEDDLVMEEVITKGDLSKLTPDRRVQYYNAVCRSLGLNPLTQPFAYITLNGKLVLYALRTCADQLRKINNVSMEIVSRDVTDDILTVHVRAKLPDGRVDEDLGAVAYPSTLRGELRANAELKCITKAKRRATLSICGLGWLDETEVADIPAQAKRPAAPAPNVMLSPHDPETGEVLPSPPPPSPGGAAAASNRASYATDAAASVAPPAGAWIETESGLPPSPNGGETAVAEIPTAPAAAKLSIEDEAREAARHGWDTVMKVWNRYPPGSEERRRLKVIEKELMQLNRDEMGRLR
jgi:hypothetical protein